MIPRSRALKVLNYLLLSVSVIVIFVPILIVFNISFKSDFEYTQTGFSQLASSFFNFDNYITYINKGHFWLAIKNTFVLMGVSVLLSVVFGLMAAYVLSRFSFPLRILIIAAFTVIVMIPTTTTQLATFKIIQGLGFYNTMYAGFIVYAGTDILQMTLFMQFIRKIPYDLDECAMVEGASYYKIFFSLIVPLMKPAISTVIILKSINIYNDLYTQYLLMPKASLVTVSRSIQLFSTNNVTQWNLMAAGIILIMIPTLIIYLILQKYIISGISSGSVKG